MHAPHWIPLVVLTALSLGSGERPSSTDAGVAEQRARILATANAYATHAWKAGAANVMHGVDEDGVRVDTPDASHLEKGWRPDGSTNVGVPYKWGGFSSLAEFDAGVARGEWAGHVPESESARASWHGVGVDCSGFVSRAWHLPFKHSTSTLPRLYYRLESWSELEPGDVCNRPGHHVMLFTGFATSDKRTLSITEAGFPCVVATTYTTADLERMGYEPARYKPLDPRWKKDAPDPEAATSTIAMPPARWSGTGRSAKDTWSSAPDPLRAQTRGDWVRYVAGYSGGADPRPSYALMFEWLAPSASAATVRVDTELLDTGKLDEQSLGAREEAVSERALETTYVESLLDLFLETRVVGFELDTSATEPGRIVVDKRDVTAEKRTFEGHGRLRTADGDETVVRAELITSPDVPLHGVVEATIRLRTGPADHARTVVHHFALSAWRRARVAKPAGR